MSTYHPHNINAMEVFIEQTYVYRQSVVQPLVACQACPINYYQDAAGKDKCIACPEGKFAAAGASSFAMCRACQPGTFQSGGACQNCPSGWFGQQENVCTQCPSSTMITTPPAFSSDECICPAGQTLRSSSCQSCRNWNYGGIYFPSGTTFSGPSVAAKVPGECHPSSLYHNGVFWPKIYFNSPTISFSVRYNGGGKSGFKGIKFPVNMCKGFSDVDIGGTNLDNKPNGVNRAPLRAGHSYRFDFYERGGCDAGGTVTSLDMGCEAGLMKLSDKSNLVFMLECTSGNCDPTKTPSVQFDPVYISSAGDVQNSVV